jgi:hypothetical protein
MANVQPLDSILDRFGHIVEYRPARNHMNKFSGRTRTSRLANFAVPLESSGNKVAEKMIRCSFAKMVWRIEIRKPPGALKRSSRWWRS